MITNMLELWAKHHAEFVELMEYVERLRGLGYEVCEYVDTYEHYSPVTDFKIEKAYCQNYDIDREQLERERRALLDDFRKKESD